jgi:hypothetical protein
MPYSIFPNQAPQNTAGMPYSIYQPKPIAPIQTPQPNFVWVPTQSPTPIIDTLYGETHTSAPTGQWIRK